MKKSKSNNSNAMMHMGSMVPTPTHLPITELANVAHALVGGFNEREKARIEIASRAEAHSFTLSKLSAIHEYRRLHELSDEEKLLLTQTFCQNTLA
jgi:hypothetical protein